MTRVEKLKFKKDFFNIYVDKNESVFDIKRCNVLSWKTVEKGHRKINVPDTVEETRDTYFFNKVKGNPFKVAVNRILAELEYEG